MKLRPIRRPDAEAASALLAEGFPVRPRQSWAACLAAIFAHCESHGHETIGSIAARAGDDVGLCLAIPSRRVAYVSAPRDVVNLSAFYLRPGNEWMASLFLRRLMTDPSADHVDLTASQSMRKLNRRLGFADRSRGEVVVPLALSALRPSRGARLAPRDMLGQVHRRLLEAHERLGCIVAAVRLDGACHPLIFARSRHRGVAGARVILARDRELIRASLGAVARHLLRRGLHFLEFDAASKHGVREALFRTGAAPVQTTQEPEGAAIDHCFTELVFIPPPGVELQRA